MNKMFLTLCMLTQTSKAFAEYRVYQYFIRPTVTSTTVTKEYLVTSTLDPISYVSYHGGETSLKANLLRTWICPGHTGFQEGLTPGLQDGTRSICPSPYQGQLITAEGVSDGEN